MPHSTHGYNLTSLLNHHSHASIAIGRDGYWGPVTSTLDWCEENYIVTPYLAEMWNSITNGIFVLLPLIGMYGCYKTGAERRFWLSYAALMMVGVGSFLFHGTLRFEMQLLDEVPMCLGTCIFVYCHLQMFSKKFSPLTVAALFLIFTTTVTSYIYLLTPVLFQAAFILLTLTQLLTGLYNLKRIQKAHPKEHTILRNLTILSVVMILTAFVLWNTDQIHCASIQQSREWLGYPFRIGLELHAWWHCLSGYSGYVGVVASQYCRAVVLGKKAGVRFVGGVLPVCVLEEGKKVKSL